MEQIRSRFAKFMYGRYGVDRLYQELAGLAFALIILNLFIQSPIISAVVMLVFVYAYFRVFSKDIYKRQRENVQYLKHTAGIRKSLRLTYKRIRDIRTYRYRTCPDCHQTLRLKRKVGSHKTVCPKCHTKMDVRIRI